MAWDDAARQYYFGNPFADNWNVETFRKRYIGEGRPQDTDPTINDDPQVTKRLCQTLFRLSKQLPWAAHLVRNGYRAVAVGALYNGGRGLRISWQHSVWVACGSHIKAINGGPLQIAPGSIYVGTQSNNPNALVRGRDRATQRFEFTEVTDGMLEGQPPLPTGGVRKRGAHARLLAAAVDQLHRDRHCIVPADQLANQRDGDYNGGGPGGGNELRGATCEDTMKLNTILYGPPGTGKTFATTALALACIDKGGPSKDLEPYAQGVLDGGYRKPPNDETWKQWTSRFDELRKSGQIEFTTFHQNYAYEDFVEGLGDVPDVVGT